MPGDEFSIEQHGSLAVLGMHQEVVLRVAA